MSEGPTGIEKWITSQIIPSGEPNSELMASAEGLGLRNQVLKTIAEGYVLQKNVAVLKNSPFFSIEPEWEAIFDFAQMDRPDIFYDHQTGFVESTAILQSQRDAWGKSLDAPRVSLHIDPNPAEKETRWWIELRETNDRSNSYCNTVIGNIRTIKLLDNGQVLTPKMFDDDEWADPTGEMRSLTGEEIGQVGNIFENISTKLHNMAARWNVEL